MNEGIEMKKFLSSIVMIPLLIMAMAACGVRSNPITKDFKDFNWPNSTFANMLPAPESHFGEVVWDNADGLYINVGKTSSENFLAYIEECKKKGFDVDYSNFENYYSAENADGYSLSVTYDEEGECMSILLSEPTSETYSTPQDVVGSDVSAAPSTESNFNSSAITNESQPPESEDSQVPSSPADDNLIDVDISSCHAKYIKYEIIENLAGDRCIAIYYEFANNSKNNRTFDTVFSPSAFQDGISLEESFYHVNDESKSRSAEIKPGTTVTVCSGYVLRNETSDVEVEMKGWISFSDKPDDIMTISLQ